MAKTEILDETCEECNNVLIRHKDRIFCPECGEDKMWEMHIPKKIKCPICGFDMSPFGIIGPEGSHGGGNMMTPVDKPLKAGPANVQMFMCSKCLNLQQFLDETKME